MADFQSSPVTESLIERLLQACVDYENAGPNLAKHRRKDLEDARRAVRDAITGGLAQTALGPEVVAAAQRGIMANPFYYSKFGDNPVAAFGLANSALKAAVALSDTSTEQK